MPAKESDRTTPPRAQTVTTIARYYARSKTGEDVQELLHDLLVECLEPRLRELYAWFVQSTEEGDYALVTADVCEAWEVSKEDAATMLKALVDYGLLERIKEYNERGIRYVYGLPGFAVGYE